jgi:hypothetical protein
MAKHTPVTRALIALGWHFSALRHRATWMCAWVFFDDAKSLRTFQWNQQTAKSLGFRIYER